MHTINELIDDPSNKGIVIRVNSPGGSVYTSDELYEELMKYKSETKRPVLFLFSRSGRIWWILYRDGWR